MPTIFQNRLHSSILSVDTSGITGASSKISSLPASAFAAAANAAYFFHNFNHQDNYARKGKADNKRNKHVKRRIHVFVVAYAGYGLDML